MSIVSKKLFLYAVLLLLPLYLFGQEYHRNPIALFPLWGSDSVIIDQFGTDLFFAVDETPEFTPWPVNMVDVPRDIPDGGFPPYVSPSPSLTMGAPYAMTGEVVRDNDTEMWHVRLYLWQMTDNRLLYSDELVAGDRETYRFILPGMLEWIISQAGIGFAPETPASAFPRKWLYFGFRSGGNFRLNAPPVAWESDMRYVNSYNEGYSAAFHLNLQFASVMGLQAEGIFNNDYKPFEAMSLMVPAMLKFTYRREGRYLSLLGGAYINFPLSNNITYEPTIMPGYTIGINFGSKAGPGYLFLDVRWAQDLSDTIHIDSGEGFRRNMISVCIGYEFGIFNKR